MTYARHELDVHGDIDFYANLAGKAGGDILELGCESGRVAFALAMRDFSVTGIDVAPGMLAIAEVRRQLLSPVAASRVRLSHGDMTSVDLSQSFDAVIIPHYGFNYLRDRSQRESTLDVMRRHLRPDGRAAIHVVPPEAISGPLINDIA